MARTAGISGTAVALATAGGFLVYLGIQDLPFRDGLRSILSGTLPKGEPKQGAEVPAELALKSGGGGGGGGGTASGGGGGGGGNKISGGTVFGQHIASVAMEYANKGIMYTWGGATPTGFDCSGLVTYVLHKRLGVNLPSNTHTTAAVFLTWPGAKTIKRADCGAGDLCCWSGHIGIAINNKKMVNAPTFGQDVRIGNIYGGVTIRRVKAPAQYAALAGSANAAFAGIGGVVGGS